MKITIEVINSAGVIIESRSEEYPGIVFCSSVSGNNEIKITGYRPGKEGEK